MRTFSGRRICEHRRRLDLRREHLGVALNRSALTIRAYEHGTVMPPADVVGRLADVLGVAVDDLFEESAP